MPYKPRRTKGEILRDEEAERNKRIVASRKNASRTPQSRGKGHRGHMTVTPEEEARIREREERMRERAEAQGRAKRLREEAENNARIRERMMRGKRNRPNEK